MVLWRDEEHEDLSDAVWDEATAEAEVAGIIADAERTVVDEPEVTHDNWDLGLSGLATVADGDW
jgi:hypothetical protein